MFVHRTCAEVLGASNTYSSGNTACTTSWCNYDKTYSYPASQKYPGQYTTYSMPTPRQPAAPLQYRYLSPINTLGTKDYPLASFVCGKERHEHTQVVTFKGIAERELRPGETTRM